jgi:FKBP-type peptidyl-prolyl cis-trans isomerase FkpA
MLGIKKQKMNVKISLAFLAISSAMFSCNGKITETPEGDRYEIHSKGSGKNKIQDGDMLTLDMKITTELDSVFRNTWKEGTPIQVPARKGEFRGSFENALYYLTEGDSATVLINADTLFSQLGQTLPTGVPEHSDLKFLVKIQKVQTMEDYQKAQDEKRTNEASIVDAFVSEKYAKAEKMDNGMYVLKEKVGNGATPKQGDIVSVSYVGKFFDGNIFDENNPFSFPVGVGRVIPGWDFALMSMKVGEKSTFIIPSGLAYGEMGAGATIAPFTPLVFDIELFEIEKK